MDAAQTALDKVVGESLLGAFKNKAKEKKKKARRAPPVINPDWQGPEMSAGEPASSTAAPAPSASAAPAAAAEAAA